MADESKWVGSRDAVQRIMRATDQSAVQSLDSIIAFAKTGNVHARALVLTEDVHRQGSSKQTKVKRNALVPLWFWDNFTTKGSKSFNWKSGVFSGYGVHEGRWLTVTLAGVQFDAKGLDILDPPSRSARGPIASPLVGFGGRPPYEWWEDLIIEVFAQIHFGDLKPNRQADIETAMQNWISARQLPAATSTVRKRARKLWQALQREDEN